ncbi:MAG: protein phosphatase CheZ [Rhodospirillales bacterium]|nr:protein phosphatase CheZ [Rhodospirillales bacterium]
MPPQKPVFTAERLLMREGRTASNGAGAASMPVNGAAHADDGRTSAAIEALRGDIQGIARKIDSFINLDHNEIERIRGEVMGIASRIEQTKKEIGALKHPLARQDKLSSASMELSAVVAQTEEATSRIFDGVERIEEIAREVRSLELDDFAKQRVSEISDMCVGIIEACSFQDLTGQRINKVVRTLAFIEERVQKMLEIWGPNEIERLPVPDEDALDIKDSGGVVLHGPQDPEKTNSQADIDKLFE